MTTTIDPATTTDTGDDITAPDTVRTIWVRSSETRHAPAHALILNRREEPVAKEQDGAMEYAIACPPHTVRGGYAITALKARELELFPCTRCFPVAARRAGLVPGGDAQGRW